MGQIFSKTFFAYPLMAGLIAVPAVPSQGAQDCLFVAPQGSSEDSVYCLSIDTTRLKERPNISAAISGIGLKPEQVIFLRCSGAKFSTSVVTESPLTVKITVPSDASDEDILAPVAHEIGHALQLSATGSIDRLRAQFDTAQIELGADYIAGFLLRWKMGSTDRASFQRNMQTIGDYNRTISDWHGCPTHRVAAFRMGFYERSRTADVGSAYDAFLQNDYPEMIKRC